MNIKVSKDSVVIIDTEYVINKGEYKINKCYFEFSDEYTNDLVKKAIFVAGDIKKEMIIANNQCNIPHEVLNSDEVELRVYAYESQDDELILRYSPTHTTFYLREGSYVEGASGSEEITPTQFEQYEQALQEGLAEVDSKLDAMDDALTEVDNLDVDASKVDTTTTITITKKDGTTKQVQVLDGRDGQDGAKGEPFTYEDFTPEQLEALTGPAGADGQDGQDGFSPTATVSKNGNIATISITDKNGTTTAQINDGINGQDGQDGRDGYVQYTAGDNITIENNVISASGGGSQAFEIPYLSTNSATKIILNNWYSAWDKSMNLPELIVYDGSGSNRYVKMKLVEANKYSITTPYTGYLTLRFMFTSVPADSSSTSYVYSSWVALSLTNDVITGVSWTNGGYYNILAKDINATITATHTYSTLPISSVVPTNDNQLVNKKYVDPTTTTSSDTTYTIASLIGNQVYKLGEITSLTITAITTFDKESIIYFDSGSTPTNISIPDTLINLGDVPTLTSSGGVSTGTCEASKSYIIAILNNIAIWKAY